MLITFEMIQFCIKWPICFLHILLINIRSPRGQLISSWIAWWRVRPQTRKLSWSKTFVCELVPYTCLSRGLPLLKLRFSLASPVCDSLEYFSSVSSKYVDLIWLYLWWCSVLKAVEGQYNIFTPPPHPSGIDWCPFLRGDATAVYTLLLLPLGVVIVWCALVSSVVLAVLF